MQLNRKSNYPKLNNPYSLPLDYKNCLVAAAIAALLLSATAFLINHFLFHFVGNNYFPDGSLLVALSLLLIMMGCRLLFTNKHFSYLIVRELCLFFITMAIIATMTNAVQYTPFQPIDKEIVAFESLMGIDMAAIVSWTVQYPKFYKLLSFIYASLDYQMGFLPIVIIATMQFNVAREYFFLLILSAIIGFGFYYFFPTIAPASVINSDLFLHAQHATGIKFNEIHNHQLPSTIEGGMIALPSFHALWAWLCLYLCRGLPILFFLLLPINLLLIASCVLLGWHYPIDLVGSIILARLSHSMFYFCKIKTV